MNSVFSSMVLQTLQILRGAIMLVHHDAACTNVFGRILCDIELVFQGLCFFCASFLGEAATRCQVFSKNVGKVVKVKSKKDSVENHALVGLLNGVAHLLCNSTLRDPNGVSIAGHLFREAEEDATTRKKSSNRQLVRGDTQ
jgi:hypothetical protein